MQTELSKTRKANKDRPHQVRTGVIKRIRKIRSARIDNRKAFVTFGASYCCSSMDFPKWFAEVIQRNAQPQPMSAAIEATSPAFKADKSTPTIDTLTVYVGPKGGKYRFNEKGRKIYLSA